MSINAVLFQRAPLMNDVIARYGTETKCYRALYRARWPQGFRCPACGERSRSRFRRGAQVYDQCRAGRHQTTLTSGTVFAGSKLPLPPGCGRGIRWPRPRPTWRRSSGCATSA